MASVSKCACCGADVPSSLRKCPFCGAPNENYVEPTLNRSGAPQSIAELNSYCERRDVPLRRMRFFIGENCREAKAFGVFREKGDYVVYMNRSDGSRYERYRGPDEAFAVRELFGKLLDECHRRGIIPENME